MSLEIDVEKAERELAKLAATYEQKQRSWESEEDKLLLKYYRRVKVKDLANQLHRSGAAISSRMDILRKQGQIPECDKVPK
jgi:hypothetical protein